MYCSFYNLCTCQQNFVDKLLWWVPVDFMNNSRKEFVFKKLHIICTDIAVGVRFQQHLVQHACFERMLVCACRELSIWRKKLGDGRNVRVGWISRTCLVAHFLTSGSRHFTQPPSVRTWGLQKSAFTRHCSILAWLSLLWDQQQLTLCLSQILQDSSLFHVVLFCAGHCIFSN